MIASPIILVTSCILVVSQAAPARSPVTVRDEGAYKVYGGDGTVAQGWPAVSDWIDYDTLWTVNSALITGVCKYLKIAPNSDEETAALKSAIEEAADDSGLDERFILAIVIQESGGCIRIQTTYSPTENVRNPGLLQDSNGNSTCNDPDFGVDLQKPCSEDAIRSMIMDGVGLTNDGRLLQVVAESKASDDSKYYKGARLYTSGVIDASGNLGKGTYTHYYASDIANRVVGWLGDDSTCDPNTIGNVNGSLGNLKEVISSISSTTFTSPSSIITSTAVPLTANTTSFLLPGITSSSVAPVAVGAVADCKTWYVVRSGDDCKKVEASLSLIPGSLQELNKELDDQCSNLLRGKSYCISNGSK